MHPLHFKAFIGGYTGPSYGVRWQDDCLFHDRFDHGYELEQTVEIKPTALEWERFLQQMDAIAVWSWAKGYTDPGVCDGAHWSLEVEANGKQVVSAGSNAYPEEFDQFCKAVSRLTGGQKFE